MPSLQVHFGHSELRRVDTEGRLVVVIDVLRASTTIVTALDHGAAAVWAVGEPADARRLATKLGRSRCLLGGERDAVRIRGFDLGNSPLEYTPAVVGGKHVVITTTNGTRALIAGQRGAHTLCVGAFANHGAVLLRIREALRVGRDVAIICSGSDGRFSLEDATCAGHFVRGAQRIRGAGGTPAINDAARTAAALAERYPLGTARLFRDADHGRTLRNAGFARDLVACREVDRYHIVPVLARGGMLISTR